MGIFGSKHISDKANIVLVHGFWVDGSGWSKLIPSLQSQGHFVIAEQNAATSLADSIEGEVASKLPHSWPSICFTPRKAFALEEKKS